MLPLTIERAIGLPGGSELFLILLIVMVLFGYKRIPKLGGALGEGINNFRKSFAGKDEPEEPKPLAAPVADTAQAVVAEPAVAPKVVQKV